MTIETVAILYQPATNTKSCQCCIYGESNIAKGLHCIMFDLPTRKDMRCGVFLPQRREQEPVSVNQGELF